MSVVGLVAYAGDAQATLCDVTEQDFLEVQRTYDLGGTWRDMLYYLHEPMDCGRYGDLCEIMGRERAELFYCELWDDLLEGASLETITGRMYSSQTCNKAWWQPGC